MRVQFESAYCAKEEVVLELSRYHSNGNKALQLYSLDGEPILTATANPHPPGDVVPDHLLPVKDWSENEGVVDGLKKAGIIEGEPELMIPSGFVTIDCYRITAKFADKWPVREA